MKVAALISHPVQYYAPIFRALAVLDGRAGTFLVGLDAQYKYDSSVHRLYCI